MLTEVILRAGAFAIISTLRFSGYVSVFSSADLLL
jgi:hypothetical protein